MGNRKEYNKKILEKIDRIIDSCPNLRFIQLLWALRIIDGQDRFYEESEDTNKIVEENFNKLLKLHNE